MLDNKVIITYGGKNFMANKFTAYENIYFSYKNEDGNFSCSFSCKFDFSGSELIIEKYFYLTPFLEGVYVDKKLFGFLPVSFRKINTAHEFLTNNPAPKLLFLKENVVEDSQVLFKGFCSDYIKWIAVKLNAQDYLNEVITVSDEIFKQIEKSQEK